MNPVQVICRKRDGEELSLLDITRFMAAYVAGTVPDYQMAAFAMAVLLRGMTDNETAALTEAMLLSGVELEWSAGLPVVDKHSTGGIGDKVSLVLAPLLAAAGMRVPMLSGRGLGPTGGTLDKLEAIPGFRTDLNLPELQAVVDHVGCVITGTTADLVPADRKLYALRDVTGTVPSIPLITASIMSKKLAENLQALVLDVKWGSGAFMQTREQAETLARSMVRVGQLLGTPTVALLTDMNQPLGRMCGNAIEIDESLDCLRGGGPSDLRDVTLTLGAELLRKLDGRSLEAAHAELERLLASGAALQRFEQMVAAQGGDLSAPRPRAGEVLLRANRAGIVSSMNVAEIGFVIIDLGGGRRVLTDRIDHSVGIEMLVRLGDEIAMGQPLARVFARQWDQDIEDRLRAAILITNERVPLPELIVARIE